MTVPVPAGWESHTSGCYLSLRPRGKRMPVNVSFQFCTDDKGKNFNNFVNKWHRRDRRSYSCSAVRHISKAKAGYTCVNQRNKNPIATISFFMATRRGWNVSFVSAYYKRASKRLQQTVMDILTGIHVTTP